MNATCPEVVNLDGGGEGAKDVDPRPVVHVLVQRDVACEHHHQ